MANQDPSTEPDVNPVPETVTPPPPAKKVEMEVDQKVRHAAGQKLGNKETLTDAEREKLSGKTPDPSKA